MINRIVKNANYSTISNVGLNDVRLSLKAKGLYAYLLSKPDSWKITRGGLESQLKEGREAIRGALRELEEAGYIKRDLEHDEKGQISTVTTLYEVPQNAEEPVVRETRTTVNPLHGKPVRIVSTDKTSTNKVNTDSKGTDVPLAEAEKQTYGDSDINHLLVFWHQTLGYAITSKKQANRFAIHNLLKRYKVSDIERLVQGAAVAASDQYAPRVSDFVDLQSKLNQLLAWGKRHDTKKGVVHSV